MGEAVKVTEVPLQMLPEVPEAIATAGVTELLTLIVTVLEVAVDEDAHAALDVMTQETTSPLANVEEVKVALLVPAFTPFTFHW